MRIPILLGILCGFSSAVLGQSYPSRAVRFVVPYAAGGPADIVARVFCGLAPG